MADAITAVFVDLSVTKELVKKPVAEMTAAEMWAVFIAKAHEPAYRGIVREIINKREGIFMAQEALVTISQDEDERARLRSRRIWEMDQACEKAAVKDYIAREIAEGIAEGKREAKREAKREIDEAKRATVRVLLDEGMDISLIARAVKMPEAEVEKIRDNGSARNEG